jgi:hypothetical protein
MPIPKPSADEKESEFISRCMGDSVMNKDYPDNKQRAAICYGSWKNAKGENMNTKKRDEKGRIIVAENVPIIIEAVIGAEDDSK